MNTALRGSVSSSCFHSILHPRSDSRPARSVCLAVKCYHRRPQKPCPRFCRHLPAVCTFRQHTVGATATEVVDTQPQPANEAAPPPDMPPQWRRLLEQQEQGEVIESKIAGVNKGGVLVDIDGVQGFIPFSKLDKSRFDQSQNDNRNYLIGQEIKAKLIQVDVPNRRLVLMEGIVTSLRDYGAFVSIRSPDGELHGTQGLIHISELSWSRISTPEMVVQPGSIVRCKVISVDREGNRIGLSLKQMEADPLMETLESVLPAGEQPDFSEVPCDIPPTIEDICSVLKTTGGIEAVNLGRCAREKRAVSQDLEVWIAKTRSEDGFNLVARSGSLLFEIHVVTSKSAADMRKVLQLTLQQIG
ncbi:hypothetical protein WJX84_012330 [Apatococcus fuscideae]|uniref:S1 motif domain-containing protein n=1 Tax=Apatococcus fuscideae TaxID=2026836 RepID=A0AAW1STK4_9CHLO